MKLLVNNEERELKSTAGTYGELMKQLSLQLTERGSTILQVKIDGMDATGVHEDEVLQIPLEEIERLELVTGFPEQIALETLKTAAEWVARLIEEMEKCADLLRLGDEVEANTSLTRFIDGFQLFSLGLQKIEAVVQRSGTLEAMDQMVKKYQERINNVLDEIITAQDNQDWIMLADLLEYELMIILEDWQDVSQKLEEQLQTNMAVL